MVEVVGESGDIWRKFYLKGKEESIVIETIYSESELKQQFEAEEAIDKMLTGTK